jgi:hypothetical protein
MLKEKCVQQVQIDEWKKGEIFIFTVNNFSVCPKQKKTEICIDPKHEVKEDIENIRWTGEEFKHVTSRAI